MNSDLLNNKYLIVKGCAGLGNRLVTLFSAIKYCERNSRVLVIDWEDGQFDVKGTNAFDKCFDIANIKTADLNDIENWSTLNHSSILFKENKYANVYDLYVDRHSNLLLTIPEKVFITSGMKKMRRRWQPIKNGSYFNSINYGSDLEDIDTSPVLYYVDFLPYINYDELPHYIKLKPFLKNKISNFIKNHKIDEAIGIHIRNTDKRPTTEVSKVLDYILLKHPYSTIYLSTDSVDIEKLFTDKISDLVLYPKTKPNLKGEGLHQWALYNNNDDFKYTLFEESVIEMFLLSKCNYLFYQGNSTFSNISKVYHPNKNNCHDWLKL